MAALEPALVPRFAAAGGRIVADEVRDLRETASGVEVSGAAGRYLAARAVLAAGPWSAPLARRLGCRVPLVAERGDQLMLPQAEMPLARPIYDARHGVVVAPMGAGLRLMAGSCRERGPSWRRAGWDGGRGRRTACR